MSEHKRLKMRLAQRTEKLCGISATCEVFREDNAKLRTALYEAYDKLGRGVTTGGVMDDIRKALAPRRGGAEGKGQGAIMWDLTEEECEALPTVTAIEWLKGHVLGLRIHAPQSGCRDWTILWHQADLSHPDGRKGPTLPLALHAAVTAVMEAAA